MNKKDYAFENEVIFIAQQIHTFRNQVCDNKFMNGTTGIAVKKFIQRHPIFKRIKKNRTYREKIIGRLNDLIEPEILKKAIKNIL
jgi:hypothetical protein